MSVWQTLTERWKNSVVHLYLTKAIYDYDKPFLQGQEKKTNATGFIVDVDRGLVLTNEHVVKDATSVVGRLFCCGQQNLGMTVFSSCPPKDLAICQFSKDSLAMIKATFGDRVRDLNMVFTAKYFPEYAEEVMSLGFPLCEDEIKFTVGVISGFNIRTVGVEKELVEDACGRPPVYLQTDTPLNPGNSGGPMIDGSGEVVGVSNSGIVGSQGIGYVIGAKTVLAVYAEMLRVRGVACLPTLGLGWARPTPALLEDRGAGSGGIYVRKVFPDSCLGLVRPGDILSEISYMDEGRRIRGVLDRFGDVFMYEDGQLVTDRRLLLAGFVDLIPIGVNLKVVVFRKGVRKELVFPYSCVESERVRPLYPAVNGMDYCIFGGVCLMKLACNHLADSKRVYDECVVVTHVFPETLADQVGNFEAHCRVDSINQVRIKTLSDIRRVPQASSYAVETGDGACFVISHQQRMAEDQRICQKYGIAG